MATETLQEKTKDRATQTQLKITFIFQGK